MPYDECVQHTTLDVYVALQSALISKNKHWQSWHRHRPTFFVAFEVQTLHICFGVSEAFIRTYTKYTGIWRSHSYLLAENLFTIEPDSLLSSADFQTSFVSIGKHVLLKSLNSCTAFMIRVPVTPIHNIMANMIHVSASVVHHLYIYNIYYIYRVQEFLNSLPSLPMPPTSGGLWLHNRLPDEASRLNE